MSRAHEGTNWNQQPTSCPTEEPKTQAEDAEEYSASVWQVCTDRVDRVAPYKVSVVVEGVPITWSWTQEPPSLSITKPHMKNCGHRNVHLHYLMHLSTSWPTLERNCVHAVGESVCLYYGKQGLPSKHQLYLISLDRHLDWWGIIGCQIFKKIM